jgi:hypothetical protein
MRSSQWTTQTILHAMTAGTLTLTGMAAIAYLLLTYNEPMSGAASFVASSPAPTFTPASTATPEPEPTCCQIVIMATYTPVPTATPMPAPSPNVSIATAIATPTMPPPAELISFPPVEGEWRKDHR